MKFHEAIELMRKGKKLTHLFFSANEWVTIDGLIFVFEDGVRCSHNQFLLDRTDLAWLEDWSLFDDTINPK